MSILGRPVSPSIVLLGHVVNQGSGGEAELVGPLGLVAVQSPDGVFRLKDTKRHERESRL